MEEKERQIKALLQHCGMEVYVSFLFPALSKDINITALEMSRIMPEYNKFTATTQITRLNTARMIFKRGWEYDALEIIASSSRVPFEIKRKASEMLV